MLASMRPTVPAMIPAALPRPKLLRVKRAGGANRPPRAPMADRDAMRAGSPAPSASAAP